jgi:hypothetical protein
MPVPPAGLNDDALLADVMSAKAVSKLTPRAKTLTIGDTWRLQGWGLDGDPAPNEEAVLKQLDLEDMKSVSRALEQHLIDRGNTKGWRYKNPTYACGGCTTCAVVVPPDMTR